MSDHHPADDLPAGATEQVVEVPGGHVHLVEQGDGPLVLLLHGFPESWRSWRRQLPALAQAGYRAAAIDLRGYGGSSVPAEVEAYRMLAHVADNVGVVRALGAESAVVVGHDWGSPITASSALLRPDLFRAVGLLSVPYTPRGGPRPTSIYDRIGGEESFYVSHFQQPGVAEAEIEPDVRGWLAGFYAGLSADTMGDRPAGGGGAAAPGDDGASLFFVPPGRAMRDRFPAGRLPGWLSEAELDRCAAAFERAGISGALNRYRNVDRDWEDLAAWDGLPVTQPSIFIAGERDASTGWLADAIDAHTQTLPGLSANHLLAGCGHWVQQERPDEVSRLLIDWLDALPSPSR